MKSYKLCSLVAAAGLAVAGNAAAQTAVSFVNGRLSLTTNNTNQNVKVEMKEANGVARLFGFQGIPDGASYSGVSSIVVTTGTGRDEVQFDIEQSVSLALTANTGAGDALTKTQWKIRPGTGSVNASLSLQSAPGGVQLAEVNFDPETQGSSTIAIDTGNATEVAAKVIGDDPSSAMSVAFAARARKTDFEVVSAAADLTVNLSGTHASTASEVMYSVNQLRAGPVRVTTNTTLSGGADKLEAKVIAPFSNTLVAGTIAAGAGSDLVKLEVEGISNRNGLTISGNAGNDLIEVLNKGVFQLSQTLGLRINGNEGNDQLKLLTDSIIRGTGLPNDRTPIIDGGVGFDRYLGFGQIINCEARL
jgi:hypothetical protein